MAKIAILQLETKTEPHDFIRLFPVLIKEVFNFAAERDWARHDIPNNLVLAILSETGELASLVQWNSPHPFSNTDDLGQEIADIFIYLLRLINACDMIAHITNTLKTTNETITKPLLDDPDKRAGKQQNKRSTAQMADEQSAQTGSKSAKTDPTKSNNMDEVEEYANSVYSAEDVGFRKGK